MDLPQLFCFGYGYTAYHLCKILEGEFNFAGTKRKAGSNSKIFEFDHLKKLSSNITHILVSIPPVNGKDLILEKFKNEIIDLPNLKWLGILSTTGVYGNHDGAWVDENSHLKTQQARSLARINLENAWLKLYQQNDIPVHIFRLSAIYGPGRSEFDRIIAGKSQIIVKPNQYFSRIHVEDIASCLANSIRSPMPGEIFNLTDDLPSLQSDLVIYAHNLLGLTPPHPISITEARLSDMMRSFYSESKRVNNSKMKSLLLSSLKYPTYREGLLAIAINQFTANQKITSYK